MDPHQPPKINKEFNRPESPPYSITERILLILGVAVFATLRIWYWYHNSEPLASDMRDFHNIALRVMERFSFEHSPFWQSYKPPLLPLLGAFVFSITSPDSLLAWQIFQTALQIICVLWLFSELRRVVSPWWFAVSVVWVIALSRSSIFWTIKFSTECLAETGVYALAAATLFALRSSAQSSSAWMLPWSLVGIVGGVACLNRPNFLASIVALVVCAPILMPPSHRPFRSFLASVAIMIGCIIAWSPWMVRTYRIYGVPMIGNTSSGGTLIFNLGEISHRRADGTIELVEYYRSHHEAPKRFANDREANKYLVSVFSQWLMDDPERFMTHYAVRLLHTAQRPRSLIALSTVPRDRCFSDHNGFVGRLVDGVLLDKSWLSVFVGAFGLLVQSLVYRHSATTILFLCSVPSWLLAIAFQGTPRMIEPIVPTLLVGCTTCLVSLVTHLMEHRRHVLALNSDSG